MKLFKKIVRKISSVPKSFKVLAVAASTLAVVSGAVFAGWTSTGIVYDWNDPAQRQGSVNGPVFNSFINTPYYGDERAFFDARMSDSNDTRDVLPYVTNGTKEVILRTYVHNNANQSTNASGQGVAKNTRVRIDLPTGNNTAMRMRSYISADNAVQVTDTAELVDSKAFGVSYVPGSARMYNAANPGGAALSDNIVTTGALIGYNSPNGDLPGCFEYQTFVEIRVRIVVPDVSITKEVRNPSDTTWKKDTTVKPGETVRWMVTVRNTGTTRIDETTVKDALPPHLTVVPGSVRRTDGANNGVVQNDAALFTTGGINFKSYAPAAALYVRFDTVAKDDFEGCEVRLRNQAYIVSTQTPEKRDTADVVIRKDNCVPPARVVNCDALTATKYALKTGESTTFTANASATNGATITGYEFFVNGTSVQNSTSNTFNFTRTTAGEYTVRVVVKSSEGDRTSAACEKKVTVTEEVVSVVRCDALTAPKLTLKAGESTTFTASGTATNTTITGYIFSVNGTVVQDSASNTYTFTQNTSGTYTVTATVKSPIGNVTSPACAKTVDVVKEEIKPVYRCEALTLSAGTIKTGEKVKVSVRFSAKDGATFKLATFKWGDNSANFVTNKVNGDIVEAEHVYTAKGNYGIQVALTFTVNGQDKVVEGGNCVAQLVVDTPPTTPPTELPSTGAGSMAALFAGVTIAGAALHNLLSRRGIRG